MTTNTISGTIRRGRLLPLGWMLIGALLPVSSGAGATVTLADQPVFSSTSVAGALALALSVEWPTATSPAYSSNTAYSSGSTFLGYFDPAKCYQYTYNSTTPASSYFKAYGNATSHTCASNSTVQLWSGNYLNWASMQVLDAFRWVLTGGYRSVDINDSSGNPQTILTKTNATYDSSGVMPNKSVAVLADISGATPFTWSQLTTRLHGLGTRMWMIGNTSDPSTASAYNGQWGNKSTAGTADSAVAYEVYINVEVCNVGKGAESNCKLYPVPSAYTAFDYFYKTGDCTSGATCKPVGLMQQYAGTLRYSTFGYLNEDGNRDGGVMRARMKFIGDKRPPQMAQATTSKTTTWLESNQATLSAGGTGVGEWDSQGLMIVNPDADDASSTVTEAAAACCAVTIGNSGAMNYLNKFGSAATSTKSYKSNDPSAELYYAATRYFRNLGNVANYSKLNTTSSSSATNKLDGFPVITSSSVWQKTAGSDSADTYGSYGVPIARYCQTNFILGIGDVNSWYDVNLPGGTLSQSAEPAMPTEVTNDTTVNVTTATNMVGKLEGYSGNLGGQWNDSGRGNGMYIAGLAYDAHTKDIRSDLTGTQTINTYWVDVLEGQLYRHKNQYYLAAKYGGFTVPSGFSPYAAGNGTSTLTDSMWYTTGTTVPFSGTSYSNSGQTYSTDSGQTDKRPDNYFPGNRPDLLQSGLIDAFQKMKRETSSATTTALASSTPRMTYSGNANYSVAYDPSSWSSTLQAQTVSYSLAGAPVYSLSWDATALLDAATYTSRNIVTCCTAAGAGLAFTYSALSSASLDSRTNYQSFANIYNVPVVGGTSCTSSAATCIQAYINYLSGARSNEQSSGPYRTRAYVLGDIVDAKLLAIGAPTSPYSDTYNSGYSTFKTTYTSRTTMLYAGANDGMLHAFDGRVPGGGAELFAYIPSFVYGTNTADPDWPTQTVAQYRGLAALGSPAYSHHYYVNATPVVADVDFSNTSDKRANGVCSSWCSILVGGLGHGGKGYYALNVTSPTTFSSSNVLWEFTSTHMGYSLGDAAIIKTSQYGWVVVLPSGINNDDGNGYLYFLDPSSGRLLTTITLTGSASAPLNLIGVTAYVQDYTDFTADAIYATDLQGNVWRVDLTGSSPVLNPSSGPFATLTDGATGQPVTTKPLIEIDPNTGKRYVLIATGQMLSTNDTDGTDTQSKQTQTFYAIIDGTYQSGKFYTSATLPSGVSFPVTRANLLPNTDLTAGVTATAAKPMGWYYDLTLKSAAGVTERINVQPTATNDGIVAFVANLPNGDACFPAGTAEAFAVSFGLGKSAITDTTGAVLSSVPLPNSATDIAFQSVNQTVHLYVGSSVGTVSQIGTSFAGDSKVKRLSWREIPTAD